MNNKCECNKMTEYDLVELDVPNCINIETGDKLYLRDSDINNKVYTKEHNTITIRTTTGCLFIVRKK